MKHDSANTYFKYFVHFQGRNNYRNCVAIVLLFYVMSYYALCDAICYLILYLIYLFV